MLYTYKHLKVEKLNDYIVRVSLNRPGQLNALNDQIWQEIGDAFIKLDEDSDCRVVILCGEGRAFTAGLDLKGDLSFLTEYEDGQDVARKARTLRKKILGMQAAFTNIEKCSKPVIAAIHGICFGAGIDMTSAADIRFCSEDAVFSVKEVDIGMAADVGTLNRLPKICGNDSWIKDICITGRIFKAEEAERFGFVSKVLKDRDELYSQVMKMALTIALKSPVATQGTKVVLNYARDHSIEDSLNFVATWNASQLLTDDVPSSAMASLTKSSLPSFSKL
ncbi:unnamed protein product [Auanema sp. JU1783]|nr:unnamed protein product [Auanema sp. JU1783]